MCILIVKDESNIYEMLNTTTLQENNTLCNHKQCIIGKKGEPTIASKLENSVSNR